MTKLTAQQIASSESFQIIAMAQAFELVAEKTGISIEDLQAQFLSNKELQKEIANLMVEAAKVTAERLAN